MHYSPPAHAYALGQSRGVLSGVGLLAARAGGPFDGYVILSGGNGYLGDLTAFTQSYLTDGLIPLTGLPNPLSGLPAQEVEEALASEIGVADPANRALVLSGQASALDYDVTTRPRDVQRSWRNLEYGAKIAAPFDPPAPTEALSVNSVRLLGHMGGGGRGAGCARCRNPRFPSVVRNARARREPAGVLC